MMLFRNAPIQKKLLLIILLINGIVLLVACIAFFGYEYYIFRKGTIEKLTTIALITAANSTAALAFENTEDAAEILATLKTEPHIVSAGIYNTKGIIFSKYVKDSATQEFPANPQPGQYHFQNSYLEGSEPIMLEDRQLGTLYLKCDLGAMYERMRLYTTVVGFVLIASLLLAYLLVKILKKNISAPIIALARTAAIISDKHDFTVRAVKMGNDEIGTLTNAFNEMLEQIQQRDATLREFNENLEQKIRDRTKQLESVNKELEGFSYSVSHDLRAPLRAIIGYSAMLEEDYADKLDDEARRITAVIKSNTAKMGQLIDDLLAFSRMSRQDMAKATVDMSVVVTEVREVLATQFDFNRIHWKIEPLPVVPANANMIKQVWINLISNAIKYSSKREIAQVEIGAFSQNGNTVFFVRDNGAGFNQQYAEKLFKVFQRLHSATEYEGTGIGLALVEKIISKQGGSVWAEGEEDKGACFYFSLPT
ncbi:MAG TPA: ATP-binding protein [Niastella sp.]